MLSLLTLRQNLHERKRQRGKEEKVGGEGKGGGNYIFPMNFLTLSRSFSSLKCNGVSRAFNCQQGLSLERLPFFPFQHSCSHEIFFLSSEIHIKQKTLRGVGKHMNVKTVSFV